MPRLRGIDYAAAGLSAQGMRWTQGKGYAAGKDPFPVRETLSSACRPSFMRSFLRVIIPRARDAPICLPSARPARLLARNFRPCAPDAPICLPPVRPVRLPARNFCPCAPGAFAYLPPARPRLPARNFCPCAGRSICLPPVRPARLPARNFRPCAGRSHLLAVRPARAPSCTQFSPVRRTHFAPARFEPHGNGGAPARRAQRREKDAWHGGRIGSPVEAVTHPSRKLNKKYSAHPFIWGYRLAGSPVEAVTHSSTKLNKSSFPHLGV